MGDTRLSEFIKPPPRPTGLDVDRQWWEVRARLRRRSQVRRAAVAASVVVALGLAGLLFRTSSSSSVTEVAQAATVTSTASPVAVALHDGSKVELQPYTRVQVATQTKDEVVLLLDEGSVSCDVAKNPSRRFIVRAADVEVRVVGTAFEVRRSSEGDVTVVVQRGIVEVRSAGELHRLLAGESWSRSARVTTLTEPEPEALEVEEADEVAAPTSRTVTKRKVKKLRAVAAVAKAPEPAPGPVQPAGPVVAAPKPTARAIFEAAVQSRSKGKVADAIAGFEDLLRQYPESSFSALSAFELGRLQMDSRKNPRAAARAFERVLATGSDLGLREDAMGRLVEAYASFDKEECQNVRARYLASFPKGTHAKDVVSSCPP